MEALPVQSQSLDEINWDDLIHDLERKRCVLFLGPFLPLYQNGDQKMDFYSMASFHLTELLLKANFPLDDSQSLNLSYTSQKFITFKKNYRPRLEDEIIDLYKKELEKIDLQTNDAIPALYKKILSLSWHTIVNTQPDNFFEDAISSNDVFSYYDFKNKSNEIKKVNDDQLLVYNLFGAIINEKSRYSVDSLILTEEDQVEFIRNLVSENPRIPVNVLSRFDNDKIYIFLDCNLEHWYFRLLLEALKIHKESHTFSSRSTQRVLPPYAAEFYKNRYGFVFINDNAEEFIDELVKRTGPLQSQPKSVKKLFIAYHDSDEDIAHSLIYQFEPWVKKKELEIWSKENIDPADPLTREREILNMADGVILLISAKFLNENYSDYVEPAIARSLQSQDPVKVFAVIESSCPWEQTPVKEFKQRHILPANRIPIKQQQQEDPNKILYEIADSITAMLWE